MSSNWFEIALFDHWGPQPHGIARVTQNLFIASLKTESLRYFYYCPVRHTFVEPIEVGYFSTLATSDIKYCVTDLPDAKPLEEALTAGDQLMIVGAGWGLKNYLADLDLIKRSHELKIACVIYDIIAIHSPQFFLAEFAKLVGDFQKGIVSISDHVACISENTAEDVREYLITDSQQSTSVFKMGADFPCSSKDTAPSFSNISFPAKYILAVGTIEARKNHILLYYVMRTLVSRYGDNAPDLVVVGRVGWLSENVIELMRRDPLVCNKIHIHSEVNDECLEQLYRSCMFTVYPSFYEGYGLPIIESLVRGKVCICSNTSSMLDITPFKELTFNPYDPMGAANVISDLVQDESIIEACETTLREHSFSQTWDDSYRELSAWYVSQ